MIWLAIYATAVTVLVFVLGVLLWVATRQQHAIVRDVLAGFRRRVAAVNPNYADMLDDATREVLERHA